ncbi:MAG: glycosyltransferase [Chitinophagales bacterium]|nr:glycosyltransferase [Chitinophagales bacterium]
MKVSICCITYNHESFIAKALDSFLMQQTNFDFEIVVGEDCSTDNTRNILLDFKKKNPEKIKLICNQNNIGVFANLDQTLLACTGEYIAICDGDDYWIDPLKLQKQVDFLEKNKECSLCYTNNFVMRNGDQLLNNLMINSARPTKHSFKWMLNNFAIASPSTWLLRSNALPSPLPEWMRIIYNLDIAMEGLLSLHGDFGYLDYPASVYRIHEGGIISAEKDVMYKSKNLLYNIDNLSKVLSADYRSSIALHRADHLEFLAFENLKQRNVLQFFSMGIKSLPYQYGKNAKSWRTTGYRFRNAIRKAIFPEKKKK